MVSKVVDVFFVEELGIVVEVKEDEIEFVMNVFFVKDVFCLQIGKVVGVGEDVMIFFWVRGEFVLEQNMVDL